MAGEAVREDEDGRLDAARTRITRAEQAIDEDAARAGAAAVITGNVDNDVAVVEGDGAAVDGDGERRAGDERPVGVVRA